MIRKVKTWQHRLVAVCVIILFVPASWIAYKYYLFDHREFTIVKPWATGEEPVIDSEAFTWTHRQCRRGLAKASTTGQMQPWLASDIRPVNERTWRFTLPANLRWSDDGSSVKAFDFVATWQFRREKISVAEFVRIKSIASMDETTLDLELKGAPDFESDLKTLNSIWLTAIKNPEGEWNWEKELSGPCYGPFVTKSMSKELITLKRNNHWREMSDDMVRIVHLIPQNPAVPAGQKIIASGVVSFAIHPGLDMKSESNKTFVTRSSIEPTAFYMLINPNGFFSGKLQSFPHLSINRGELSGTITNSLYFNVMYRMLPLTFLNDQDSGFVAYFPNFNLESHLEARRLLGFLDDMPSDKLKFPPNRNLGLATPDDQRLNPIIERYVARLRANYNIQTDVISTKNGASSSEQPDLTVFAIDLAGGVDLWARDMVAKLRTTAPGQTEMIAYLEKVASIKVDHQRTASVASILRELDDSAPRNSLVVPLGQFGTRFMVDEDVLDIVVTGDRTQDPDITRARWVKREFKL